jgi:hypothetical protein
MSDAIDRAERPDTQSPQRKRKGSKNSYRRRPRAAAVRPGTRTCLGCGQRFYSEGIGNRVCSGCKAGDAWQGRGLG